MLDFNDIQEVFDIIYLNISQEVLNYLNVFKCSTLKHLKNSDRELRAGDGLQGPPKTGCITQ